VYSADHGPFRHRTCPSGALAGIGFVPCSVTTIVAKLFLVIVSPPVSFLPDWVAQIQFFTTVELDPDALTVTQSVGVGGLGTIVSNVVQPLEPP